MRFPTGSIEWKWLTAIMMQEFAESGHGTLHSSVHSHCQEACSNVREKKGFNSQQRRTQFCGDVDGNHRVSQSAQYLKSSPHDVKEKYKLTKFTRHETSDLLVRLCSLSQKRWHAPLQNVTIICNTAQRTIFRLSRGALPSTTQETSKNVASTPRIAPIR